MVEVKVPVDRRFRPRRWSGWSVLIILPMMAISIAGAATVSRQAIKDRNFKTIGYIETMSDGKQKALDANFHTLGHYDPKRNVTQGTNFHTIAQGNVLSGLIFK